MRNEKCYGCYHYDPCWMKCRLGRDPKVCSWMKCRLGRDPKDCTFYAILKLTLSSLYGTQVRE